MMKTYKDKYKATLQVYQKLGKAYVKNRDRIAGVEEMQEFLNQLPKGARILDVGCSGGRDARVFLRQGFSVVGIDVVDVFLREAKKSAPQATFKKMDVLRLRFPKNSFDAIWANAVLLHLQKRDMPKVFRSFFNILKPGGIVHVRVKRGKGNSMAADMLSGGDKRYFSYFTKAEIERFMKDAGFRIIASRLFPDEFKRTDVRWISVWGQKAFKIT